MLCVMNLSRFPQPTELDLREYQAIEPVELLGGVRFPKIGDSPYPLTVAGTASTGSDCSGRSGYRGVKRQAATARPAAAGPWAERESQTMTSMVEHAHAAPADARLDGQLARLLAEWLPRQRWYSGKGARIGADGVAVLRRIELSGQGRDPALALVVAEVRPQGREPERYQLFLGLRAAPAGRPGTRRTRSGTRRAGPGAALLRRPARPRARGLAALPAGRRGGGGTAAVSSPARSEDHQGPALAGADRGTVQHLRDLRGQADRQVPAARGARGQPGPRALARAGRLRLPEHPAAGRLDRSGLLRARRGRCGGRRGRGGRD